MKIFLQKVEYSLLDLFLAVLTQVPFVLIHFYKGRYKCLKKKAY